MHADAAGADLAALGTATPDQVEGLRSADRTERPHEALREWNRNKRKAKK